MELGRMVAEGKMVVLEVGRVAEAVFRVAGVVGRVAEAVGRVTEVVGRVVADMQPGEVVGLLVEVQGTAMALEIVSG
jgi:hypothetical protein